MERTLSIVKPDGVQKHLIGEVMKRFEQNGLKVVALKMIFMDKKEAQGSMPSIKENPSSKA